MARFDKIFEEEGRGLPLAFLRALARRESGNNPKEAKGPAWGLLQVGIDKRAGDVLSSYNQRHKTALARQDMLDPRLNVRVAADLLSRIVELHVAEGITPDWQNGNWIGLIAAAWNTGYSLKAGTLKVIRYLKEKKIPVTLQSVYENAERSGAGRRFKRLLAQKKRQEWHRSVVALTFKEQGRPIVSAQERTKATPWIPLLLLVLLLRS